MFFLRLLCTREKTCESVWPPNASFYASSTCCYLRLLASPFDQGFNVICSNTSQYEWWKNNFYITISAFFTSFNFSHITYTMKRFRNICLCGMQNINFLGVIQFRGSEEKRRKRVLKLAKHVQEKKLGVIDRSLQ